MKFGRIPVAAAEGAIAAHSVRLRSGMVKKGTRLDQDLIARLKESGISEIVAAVLEAGDVHEDEAAKRLAEACAGDHLRIAPAFTGRANIHATQAGVLVIDRDGVNALNRIDSSITLATLPALAAVDAGRMVATVKIIPYGVPSHTLSAAMDRLASPIIELAPYRPLTVGLVQTRTAATKDSVLDKTLRVLNGRLQPAQTFVHWERRVGHEERAVADALEALIGEGVELLILFGASAVADRGDVIPSAIESAGGQVDYFGMPVDPGNLLLIGRIGACPVIGAPGCARSPKENGFDWVLSRLLAGIPVAGEDISGMGVGGLLMEIETRPQPRSGGRPKERPSRSVAAVVLAGGQSRRMGGPNKLVATIDGKPIVCKVVEAALESEASSVIVVTGDRSNDVERALHGLKIDIVYNEGFADGLSTSLKTGISSVPAEADAAIVLLGDMPLVEKETIDRLINAYDPTSGAVIVVPTFKAKRGNPVLWDRRFFDQLMMLSGDTGARHLIGEHGDGVVEVELGAAVSVDVDTPDALRQLGGEFSDAES